MTSLCPTCGSKTQIRDTISEAAESGWRKQRNIRPGTTQRLRRCAQGHRFHTVELTEEALDALYLAAAEVTKRELSRPA